MNSYRAMLSYKSTSFFLHLMVCLSAIFSCESMYAETTTDTSLIPVYRQYYHEKIDKLQIAIDQLDGKLDKALNATKLTELNFHLSYVLYSQVDSLQEMIESNSMLTSNNEKIRALSYIENTLESFKSQIRAKKILSADFPELIERLSLIITRLPVKEHIDDVIKKSAYPVADILLQVFMDFPGTDKARDLVYLKYIT